MLYNSYLYILLSFPPTLVLKIMALLKTRSPKLSISRSVARIRISSPSLCGKPTSNSVDNDQTIEFLGIGMEEFVGEDGHRNGNKVMVLVDFSPEAKGALEWALSHTVQSQDTIVLLYVGKPSNFSKGPECKLKGNLRAYELLHSMKNVCQRKRPGVSTPLILFPFWKMKLNPTILHCSSGNKNSIVFW